MHAISRQDAINLHVDASPTDFEAFMTEELMPYFSQRYKGPTRSSIADLKGQVLYRLSQGARRYLWVTRWDGSAPALRGASFEGTRMIQFPETGAMLKKLEAFGARARNKVFEELVSVEVPTN